MSVSKEVFTRTLRGFFRPIDALLEDHTVGEVLVNRWDEVYVDRGGKLERTKARFSSEQDLIAALTNLAQSVGLALGPRSPMLEAQLPDGSRVQALLPPVALGGPCLAIRCARGPGFSLESFVATNSEGRDLGAFLRDLGRQKRHTIVCGDAASGKTAFLQALLSEVPPEERVLALEHNSELKLTHGHVVRVEARAAGALNLADLVRAAQRMRPDCLVVGELRGMETKELVRAMSSGCVRCLATLDAPGPEDALRSIETMALAGDPGAVRESVRRRVASAVDVVIQVVRLSDGRRCIGRVSEVDGSPAHRSYQVKDVYRSESW